MRIRKHANTIGIVIATMIVTWVAPAVAHGVQHALFAHNSDKVDGKHAVGSSASTASRKGKLVATNATTGKLPNDIIAVAPDSAKLGGRSAANYLDTGDVAGGDLTGPFDDLQLGSNSVGAAELADDEGWHYVGTEGEPAWHSAQVCNAWSNSQENEGWNYEFADASFYKDALGIVHLRGTVTGGTIDGNCAMFQLPDGYKPATENSVRFAVATATGPGQLYVTGGTGYVTVLSGSNTSLSLDGVSFRAEA